jgi:alcohol dehydrogenase class IV
MSAVIALPRLMRIGAGASAELAQTMAALGLGRPLIVSDRYLTETGHVDRLVQGLTAAGLSGVRVFSDTVPDPTVRSIEAGIAFLNDGDHDCVVGFGGGSPLDSAKAIAVMGLLGGEICRYKAPHQQDAPGLPVIAIPTTAGTGSEASRFTIITDEDTSEKMLCIGLAYLPVAALVDYELTLTMPRRLTADTGLDSLTHAIESYVSKKAHPFSDAMALQAMAAIAPNLRVVDRAPDDRAAREAMMLGATLAGMAFSNASVALVHGMSRPIGAFFHVPHGLSNAMLLPVVTAYSAPAALRRYAQCAVAMGVAKDEEGDQAGVARLLDELSSLNADLGVPSPAAYGIDRQRWEEVKETMAVQALASGSPGNNPRVPTVEEIKDLYDRAYA